MADAKQITQQEGGKRISVTERYFGRLLHRYRKQGAEGIISMHRKEKREKILNKLKEDYQRLGPTLASEKLLEREGIKAKKSLRQIIATGLHQPKNREVEIMLS